MEMGMKPGTKPVGYTVRDNNMLIERAALLQIPVNEATEELFAKDELLVEQPTLPKREISPEEAAELELPIPLGKIDTFILYGYPLEHVIDFAVKNGYEDTPEHRKVVERVYRRECSMIIESTPVYKRLAELESEGGRTDDMICAELKISYPALLKMRKCMSVLNINEHEAKKADAEAAAVETDKAQAKAVVESSDMTELTKQFDETVNAHPISKEDEKRFDDKVEEQKAKRRERAKKAREKKKANQEAKKAAEAETLLNGDIKLYKDIYADASYALIGKVSDKEPTKESEKKEDDVELDLGETNLLNNTDLSAFGNLDA
jgi:hypothetical protein